LFFILTNQLYQEKVRIFMQEKDAFLCWKRCKTRAATIYYVGSEIKRDRGVDETELG
jgi:hypothetical protein